MAYTALKRSKKLLDRNPLPFVIFVGHGKEELRWDCVLKGPDGSPYEGGVFKFSMKFDKEFPRKPPTVVFKTKIHHPNVEETGFVTAGFLHSPQWNPSFTLIDIIEAVWNMMASPILDEPRYVVEAIREQYLNENEVFMWIAKSMTENQEESDFE